MYRKLLLSLITLLACQLVQAQNFYLFPNEYVQKVKSHTIAASGSYPYTMTAVQDGLFSSTNSSTGTTAYTDGVFKSTLGYVKVAVNKDTALIVAKYKYLVTIDLINRQAYSGATPAATKTIALEISYDPDSLKPYTDVAVFKFSGYHRFQASITKIEDISGTTPVTVPIGSLAKNFYVETGVITDEYNTTSISSIPIYAVSYLTNSDNNLHIKWGTNMSLDNLIQPVEFELEWTYVDDYRYDFSNHTGSHFFQSGSFSGNIPYDFRKNSTRVRLKENTYDIPLVYEGGAIVYRIRIVRPTQTNYRDVIYGAWNTADAGTVSSTDIGRAYLIPSAHMGDNLNWQYTINFAEEGKYKHVINYFDGSLRGRQTQTKINTDSLYIIALDKSYDYEGHPAIQTLPTPLQQTYLGYRDDIVKVGSSRPYNPSDYDRVSCSQPDSLPPLLGTSVAGNYYSTANTDTAGVQKFVPDAKGYPIIQSIYSPDNRLLWQGGAGYDHQLWTLHGTRYEYTEPLDGELDFYFKNEAGVASSFPKKVTMDPNLQSSFTISNSAGKPIATGLIGLPSSTTPIESIGGQNTAPYCSNILNGVQQNVSANGISINKKFYVEIDGDHSIQYRVKIPAYSLGCGNISVLARANYDFSATDECGIPRIPRTTGTLGFDSVVTSMPAGFDYYSSTATLYPLSKGNHTVNKSLLFNRNEVNYRVKQGVLALEAAQCSPSEKSFIRTSVENAGVPCINNITKDSCGNRKYRMIQELYPDAKYGGYGKKSDGSFAMDSVCFDSSGVRVHTVRIPQSSSNNNSIFTAIQVCNIRYSPCVSAVAPTTILHPSCLKFRYQDDCITMPTSVTKNGRTYTDIKNLPVDTFIYIFNDTIATALLSLHPEFCKTAFCDDGEYIEELKSFQTQKQAVQGNRFVLDSIIAHDPLYIKANSTDKPGIKTRLSFMKNNTDKRIDRIALEQAYCAAGNGQEVQHNAKFLYANEILNTQFVDSPVKQQYFEALKSLYLGNRSYILQKALDSTSATCAPCTSARMTLVEPAVFPRLFSSNSNTIASDINMPTWLKDVFNNSMDPSYNPSGFNPPPSNISDSLINKTKDSLASGTVDAIVRKLVNCSINQDTLALIKSRLLYYVGLGSDLTPAVIKTALTDVNVSVNDLCHSFLVAYNTDKDEQEYTYDCGRPELYTDLKSFLNRSEVKSVIMDADYAGSGYQTFNLNATNSFENKIAAKLGLSSNSDPVWVEGFLDTIKYSSTFYLKYVKLKITKPSTSTSISFYFKRKSSSSPYLDTASSLSVNDVSCLNDDDGLHTGYAAQYTAVADYFVSGVTTVSRRYYIWSRDIPLMVQPGNKLPLACLTCVDIKNALKAFKADKTAYGYDDAGNHPFAEITFTNYLNYKLNKRHTYYEYVNLMKGCAVSDSIELPNHFAFIRYYTSSDAIADSIVDRIGRYTSRKIVDTRIKYYGTGITHVGLDFSVVPYDSVLRCKNDLITLGVNAGATVHYLPTDAFKVLRSATCTPAPYITTYGSFSKDIAGIYNGKNLMYVDSAFTYTGSYANAYAHASLLANLKSYISTCSNSFLLKDAQLYRTEDYSSANKQNYLAYVYALEGKSRNDIRDSIDAYNLKFRLAGVSTKALKYDDPMCGENKRDLYICTSDQSTHPGTTRLNSIFSSVSGQLGSYKLFLAGTSNAQVINSNLKVYRKTNGVHWYRYFDASNNLYNAYLEPPINSPFDINTLKLDSVRIGPGTDSLNRFTAYMHYDGNTAEVIPCRGYTSFVLGYGQRVQDVVLYNKPGSQNCLDSIDCEYLIQEQAILAGKARYAFYFDSTVASHSNKMYNHLLNNTRDTLLLCTQNAKNMVTLYYYDLNGNLQRTVPPAGVDASGNAAHTKVTTYTYDSRNLLRKQITPDGGTTNFYYDAVGRLAFSQNDKQKALGKFSYTLYDELSRPKETGEVVLTSPNASAPVYVENSFNDENYPTDTLIRYVKTQTRYDVVITTYDTMRTDIGAISGENLSTQDNLLNRVSTVTYYLSKAADYSGGTDPTPHFATYYSYDAVGNVKTVSYNCPAMLQAKQQYKRVDYDYDQISGKVNMISYNHGRPDQFYQRYKYDADNRIILAETSNDGLIWNRDASYTYYKHGPLANTKIGNNQIQSLDYAYTIQGWLKTINGDVLRTDKQMLPDGATGNVTYARDAMAHAIDYFNNDYKAVVNTVNGFNFGGPAKGLYNGNIARTTTAIRGVSNSGGANDNMRASYTYDQAQRLVKAAYESITESNLTTASTAKFANNYKYDLDGNLTWLTRYNGASTVAKIDSIHYNYATNTNRLGYADDVVNNISGGTDFQKGQVAGNYGYDAIGNMTQDNQANLKMEWNLYGKLRSVDFLTSSPKKKLWYDYDGQGNRVRKDMVTNIGGGSESHVGEYYVRDASGNILTTYKFNTTFSKISLIKLTNTGIYTNPNFPKYVNAVAVTGSYVKGFADKAIDVTGTWADGQTDKPASFYFQNSPALYGSILTGTSAADYLNDLQAYDASAAPQIFSNTLMGSPTEAANLVDEVLNYTVEGKKLLEHLDEQLPDMELNQLWTNVGIDATRTPVHVQNADTLYKWMKLNSQQPAVVGAIQTLVMDPGVNPQAQAFYHAVMQDDIIFESTNLRGAGSTFTTQVENLVHANAEQSQVMEFLDGWANTGDWLAENTTQSDRLQLVYRADPDNVLADWIAIAPDVEVLDTILANAEDVLAFDYYDARVSTNSTYNVGLPPMDPVNIYSFGPVVDTTSLAEHHIYGSSRLGVQNYKDSIYRQTYNVNTSITPLTGLSSPAVWYDNRYNDLIDASVKEPYGNSHTGELTLGRTLGYRNYELTDHLGNVLATVLDRKTGHNPGGGASSYDYYLPDISTAQGYYPFGMRMKEWHSEVGDTVYKFGFNGQRREDEIAGAFNHNTALFWEYDPILGRRWNLDPKPVTYESGYAVNRDNPIRLNDPNGDCPTCITGAAIGAFTEYAGIVGSKMIFEGKSFEEANGELGWHDALDITIAASFGAASGAIDGGVSKWTAWISNPTNRKIAQKILEVGVSALEASLKQIYKDEDFDLKSILAGALTEVTVGSALKTDVYKDASEQATQAATSFEKKVDDLAKRKKPNERLVNNAKANAQAQKNTAKAMTNLNNTGKVLTGTAAKTAGSGAQNATKPKKK